MQLEKWQDILDKITSNFVVQDKGKYHLDEQGGSDVEFLIFESPIGLVKLELTSKPVVLDKKTIYSNRIGSDTNIEYVYSPTEKNYKMLAYKYKEEDDTWLSIDNQSFI
jgi:hypothetical protein